MLTAAVSATHTVKEGVAEERGEMDEELKNELMNRQLKKEQCECVTTVVYHPPPTLYVRER